MKELTRRALLGAAAHLTMAEAAVENIVDAHVHVWPAGPGRRPASFTPEELFSHARPCGVARVVLIQISFFGFDNSYMLEAIARYSGVFSGVAVIDPEAPGAAAEMRALAKRGVRGFRIRPGEKGDGWLDGPGMRAMWECGAREGLAMCPLIDPTALPSLDRMCGRFPDTPVVVDHFARIGAAGEIPEKHLRQLCGLARHPRTHVKLSAYYTLGRREYPYLDLLPMVRRLLDAFGPERLMWASDSPFQLQNGHTYRGSLELIRDRLEIAADEREWLLRKTAEKVFFTGLPAAPAA